MPVKHKISLDVALYTGSYDEHTCRASLRRGGVIFGLELAYLVVDYEVETDYEDDGQHHAEG